MYARTQPQPPPPAAPGARRRPHGLSTVALTVMTLGLLAFAFSARGTTRARAGMASATEGADGAAVEDGGFARLSYVQKRHMARGHSNLQVPAECAEWRAIARERGMLRLYKKHFTSLDVIDWFVYVAIFDEQFHKRAKRRPRYLDVAANHARRWSNTWFLDRCLGWDGVCVEANPKYRAELRSERHCHVVDTCLSDAEREVRFSFTDAWGGVVKEEGGFGVDGARHASDEKFSGVFAGVKELTCRTGGEVLRTLGFEGRVEFMSLDVEGYEFPVLQGIDWERVRIEVIVTENKMAVVREFLEEKGYVLYEGVLKDLLFVRRDSGLVVSEEVLGWMKRFDKKRYRFEGVSDR